MTWITKNSTFLPKKAQYDSILPPNSIKKNLDVVTSNL